MSSAGKRKLTAALAAVLASACLLAGCGAGQESGSGSAASSSAASGSSASESVSSSSSASSGTEEGSLQSFTADTLDGGTFTQDDLTAKDVTVINFWSVTCGPCVGEMPDLASFEKSLPDNVQLITFCIDGQDAADEAQEILDEAGYEGTTLISADGDLQELLQTIQFIPYTVFVDREGNVIGDPIIGSQQDLAGTYLDAVNAVLVSEGEEEISLG